MFRFEYIENLYAFVAIPILVIFFIAMWHARKKSVLRFGSAGLMSQLMVGASRFKHPLKFTLLILALSFLIIGWANPQWGIKKEKVMRKSIDVFIALDISQSMLAEDVSPSRLERAKQFAQKLVQQLKGERIGTIIFAGNAYLQVPLTTDYSAVQLFLKSANPNMAPTQGTAIGDAIDLAERSFEEENKNYKAIVILTDGENHDDEALSRAETARDNGLLIFTVGIGTSEGSFIPVYAGGRQDYKRDRTGNPVRTRLDENVLRELSEKGDGVYFNLANNSDQVVEALQERIDRLEKREFEQRIFNEFESYFQYFIGVALFLIFIEFFISYRRSRWMEGKDFFKG
ncbi:MAG: VWA domain-containing protein [Bacteroidetes bacterium]|nr:VWA domain-containing protein [Bacteroidota bacterium]